MKKLKKSNFFEIHELVPQEIFMSLHEEIIWRLVPENLIDAIDSVKKEFNLGTMTINNYEWGGSRNWSGLRTIASPYYSPTSQHSIFNATDSIFNSYTANEIRKYILANPHKFPKIRRLENNVSWLHLDIKDTGTTNIVTFNP